MSSALVRSTPPFAAATLFPVPLLVLGGLLGGGFAAAALIYLTALRAVLDALITTAGAEAAPGVEFPAGERLLLTLGLLHFPLLALAVAAVAGATGLSLWEGVAMFFAFGLYFGQVSNSVAHELIHHTARLPFRLGKWMLISVGYGHHVSAHLKVHHRFVATPDDPATARAGESFYAFVRRAWGGAFRAGWDIEKSLAAEAGRPLSALRHPYVEYIMGAAAFAAASAAVFGPSGLAAWVLIAGYTQLMLLLSDYVQHYGLIRRRIDDDRYEPVAAWHSWNGAHWFSGGLMVNAARHSDHHMTPARPFAELALPHHMQGPRLPYSLPAMGAIALVPPVWRRVMDRRAAAWRARIEAGEISADRLPTPVPAAADASEPAAFAGAPAPTAAPATATPAVSTEAPAKGIMSRIFARTPAADEPAVATSAPAPAADATSLLREDDQSVEEFLARIARRANEPDPPEPEPVAAPADAADEIDSAELFGRELDDEEILAQEAERLKQIADQQVDQRRRRARRRIGEVRNPSVDLAKLDATVQEMVSQARKSERLRKRPFPSLATFDAQTGKKRSSLETTRRAAQLAAHAFAALMRGGPPDRRAEP